MGRNQGEGLAWPQAELRKYLWVGTRRGCIIVADNLGLAFKADLAWLAVGRRSSGEESAVAVEAEADSCTVLDSLVPYCNPFVKIILLLLL